MTIGKERENQFKVIQFSSFFFERSSKSKAMYGKVLPFQCTLREYLISCNGIIEFSFQISCGDAEEVCVYVLLHVGKCY